MLGFDGVVQVLGNVMILQLLLCCELVPALRAHEVVVLLVDSKVALEAGQSAERLVALGAEELVAHLVRGQMQFVVLLHVVGGAALLAPEPPVQNVGLEVPLIARKTIAR